MVEQVDEERYIVFADALFIERQDEAPAGGFEEEVAVFDAFGNALARYDGADVVTRDQCGKVVGLENHILFGGNDDVFDDGTNRRDGVDHLDRKSTRLNSSH